jgi:hypothetical protein
MTEMGNQKSTIRKDDSRDETRDPWESQPEPGERIGTRTGDEILSEHEEFESAVAEGTREEIQDPVRWVEQAGLIIRPMRQTAEQRRVPVRYLPLLDDARGEGMQGEEERIQVATAARYLRSAQEWSPEESDPAEEECSQRREFGGKARPPSPQAGRHHQPSQPHAGNQPQRQESAGSRRKVDIHGHRPPDDQTLKRMWTMSPSCTT